MALRTILLEGDEALRKKCRPVTDFGKRTSDLMDDLRDSMEKAEGAGLAAPQVGILRRACVIIKDGEVIELINPEIIEQAEELVGRYEGCLSCPDQWGWVERPQQIKVKAQDRAGEWFELTCEDMAARAACHETEHLDGILFIDHVDELITGDELNELIAEAEQEEEKLQEEVEKLAEVRREADEKTQAKKPPAPKKKGKKK